MLQWFLKNNFFIFKKKLFMNSNKKNGFIHLFFILSVVYLVLTYTAKDDR